MIDSLFRGYPAGYIIIWQSQKLQAKDGQLAGGRKILIDGQQRITALMTAIAGKTIINADYKPDRIKIAFNPFAAVSNEPDAEIFAVQDQSHINDKRWISDISRVFKNEFNLWAFVENYRKANPDIDPNTLSSAITALKEIGNRRIGVIELTENLDIDIVTDIFIRINSQGTALSQGDFVMSKIAADTGHGGKNLRKLIDYFAHLSKVPAFHPVLLDTDKEFANSDYMRKLDWLKHETESVYDPDCDDVIRVAFMLQYYRSKLSELVLLLSGRDFKNREYKEEIVQQSFNNLEKGVLEVVNENNFKQFMLIIRGAGFVSPKLVNSNMALDFAYMLFLRLLNSDCNHNEAKRIVQKWYVLSVLTGRYSASPESAFGRDLLLRRRIIVSRPHRKRACP